MFISATVEEMSYCCVSLILFSIPTTGVTARSASLSSSSSTSVSLEFTSCKLSASPAGEHGQYVVGGFYTFCISVECVLKLFYICVLLCFSFPSGWITALTGLNTSVPVGIIMLLIAALFTALSVGSLIMFKKVNDHRSLQHHSRLG